MIVTLTARRLKPGSHEDFRAAFRAEVDELPEEINKRWSRVFVSRDVTDENVVLTFGLFDGRLEELRRIQAEIGGEEKRVARFEPFVEEVVLDGS
jgi:hypothetical protein